MLDLPAQISDIRSVAAGNLVRLPFEGKAPYALVVDGLPKSGDDARYLLVISALDDKNYPALTQISEEFRNVIDFGRNFDIDFLRSMPRFSENGSHYSGPGTLLLTQQGLVMECLFLATGITSIRRRFVHLATGSLIPSPPDTSAYVTFDKWVLRCAPLTDGHVPRGWYVEVNHPEPTL